MKTNPENELNEDQDYLEAVHRCPAADVDWPWSRPDKRSDWPKDLDYRQEHLYID
jgi:hypothetical protein